MNIFRYTLFVSFHFNENFYQYNGITYNFIMAFHVIFLNENKIAQRQYTLQISRGWIFSMFDQSLLKDNPTFQA